MIFGYAPSRNRTEFKKRFSKKYSSNIYKNDFLFRNSKLIHNTHILIFWILMLVAPRVGNTAFFTMAPLSKVYAGLKVNLPKTNSSKRICIAHNSKYCKIWLSYGSQVVVNNHIVKINHLKEFFTKKEYAKLEFTFLYIDQDARMLEVKKYIKLLENITI